VLELLPDAPPSEEEHEQETGINSNDASNAQTTSERTDPSAQ